jgi:hypothetical protein
VRLFVLRTGLLIVVLLAGAAEGVQASTVFSDSMNSGLDSNIEINLQNGATSSASGAAKQARSATPEHRVGTVYD